MMRNAMGRIGGIAVTGAVMLSVMDGCASAPPPPPHPIIEGVAAISAFQRDARDGGRVTVYAGVLPGPLPDTNMAGPSTTVAWFASKGERGTHEKRYDWKPFTQAQYDVVLSNDGSRRTKWTMNEIDLATKTRRPVRSGHVWACDLNYHAYPNRREVGFKDCNRRVGYDPLELAVNPVGNQLAKFASYDNGSDAVLDEAGGPIWISCTSGCCTLGAYVF